MFALFIDVVGSFFLAKWLKNGGRGCLWQCYWEFSAHLSDMCLYVR